jgi:hypothetical protein
MYIFITSCADKYVTKGLTNDFYSVRRTQKKKVQVQVLVQVQIKSTSSLYISNVDVISFLKNSFCNENPSQ